MTTAEFSQYSHWIDLGGPVHYLDFGGPPDGPVVVCVHGLGGSAVNWMAIAPLLAGRCRVLAPDLAGHGLTQSMGRGCGVRANRALLHRFIEAVPGGPVILMGNSMGGMISLIEASTAPAAVAGLALIDPALPFIRARPDPQVAALFALFSLPGLNRLLVARRRRQTPEALVATVLALCCADPSRVPRDVVAQHVALARQRTAFPDAERDFRVALRSVVATVRDGAYRDAIGKITCPVTVLHGARDRLVPVAVARATARANPSWSLTVLLDVGHVPQLEAPRTTARAISGWLGSAGLPAAGQASRVRQAEPS